MYVMLSVAPPCSVPEASPLLPTLFGEEEGSHTQECQTPGDALVQWRPATVATTALLQWELCVPSR